MALWSPVLFVLGCLFLWPLLAWAAARCGLALTPFEAFLTGLALSIGTLTTVMMWLAMLPGGLLAPFPVLAVVVVGLGAGVWANRARVDLAGWRAYWQSQWRSLIALDLECLLRLALLAVAVVVIMHVAYYPFTADDTLSRYGLHALLTYKAGYFLKRVAGYPQLVPLAYIASWYAAGTQNENLALISNALMALGVPAATYLIGRAHMGRGAGWLAAGLVALTPMFVRNSTLGYVDLPSTFFITLGLHYALRWWRSQHVAEAMLAGALLGFAMLAKQSALTWLACLWLVPALWWLSHIRAGMRGHLGRALGGQGILMAVPLLVAGPWYVRNAMIYGWNRIIPVAGPYHLLEQPLGPIAMLPPLAALPDFGLALAPVYLLGWLVGIGMGIWQLWLAVRGEASFFPLELLLVILAFPYWLAWYLYFSWDTRFLLFLLPVMALWSVRPLQWMAAWGSAPLTLPPRAWQVIGVLVLVPVLYLAVADRLGGTYRLLTQPTVTYEERLMRLNPRFYGIIFYLRYNIEPGSARIMIMDGRMEYYLLDYKPRVVFPKTLASLEGFDYLVHSSSFFAVYNNRLGWKDSEFYRHAWDEMIFEPVFVSDGVHVMRVLRTDKPTRAERRAWREARREAEGQD